ncbi:hypothetical protein H4Q26_016326 [Puccinia striiformis f. sp. tritici PST-130]|nr:hypothetical protein H4Q26_016326 [Puccinia striiformis f. sp. tritici PST-130]
MLNNRINAAALIQPVAGNLVSSMPSQQKPEKLASVNDLSLGLLDPKDLQDLDLYKRTSDVTLNLQSIDGKLLTIFEETEQQRAQSVSSSPPRIFKSIGFATVRYQNWTVLRRLLSRQKNLTRRSDVLSIISIATRKILFSTTLKTQASRIEKIIELCETIIDTFNEKTDCKTCMSQSVEIFCDALLRMSCHEYASNMVLQIIRQPHDLLAAIPSGLQTLDQFKACMSVWDRRTPRPLLHPACSVWDALVSHPHLLPDLDADNFYLSLKSKLGHVDELIKIIQNMERRQILVDDHYNNDNNQKQKTYGILSHSIGRRRGLKSAYRILPELISKGYIPDEYTSNILLSASQKRTNDTTTDHQHPVPPCRNELPVVEARSTRGTITRNYGRDKES